MRTRLIFVRHGESVHSVERFVGGREGCRGLTARGHEQAAETARRLAGEVPEPVAVYSSVLRRALETAGPIAAALGAEVAADGDPATSPPTRWTLHRFSRASVDPGRSRPGGNGSPAEQGRESRFAARRTGVDQPRRASEHVCYLFQVTA